MGQSGVRWPAGASRDVLLYGNSYAAQWRETIAALLPKGVRLTTVTTTACDPVNTATHERNRSGASCAATAKLALAEAVRLKPSLVVFSMAVVRNAAMTREMLKGLAAGGAKVLWIGVVPAAPSFERCLGRHGQLAACNATPTRAKLGAAFDLSFTDLAASAGAGYVGLTDVYCRPSGCPALVEGAPVRTDGSHLTYFGMRGAVPKLSAAIALTVRR